MSEHEYEPYEFGPEIEKDPIPLSEASQQVLRDTLADLSKGKHDDEIAHYAKWFNNRLDGTTKRRQKVALVVGALTALTVSGVAMVESAETPAPRYDLVAEAKIEVLRNPQALGVLGICSLELRAQANMVRAQIAHNMGPTDGIGVADYERAANVAAQADISCVTDPNRAHYETKIQGQTVAVEPWQITEYNLDDACTELVRDVFHPEELPFFSDLKDQDIQNQRLLLFSSGRTCPEAGLLGIPSGK